MTMQATMRTTTWAAPLPAFFDPKNAAKWGYHPDISKVLTEAHAWRKSQSLRASKSDSKKVQLLLIDEQQDFCLPQGTLYVGGRSGTGSIDDSRRVAEFIYRNLGMITNIAATLDTHITYQIFFQSFWNKADGSPVDPFTTITAADLDQGKYVVSPLAAAAINADYVWLTQYVRYYCEQLEKTGKYQLYIWPFHCLLGTEGHSLVGIIEEACAFHAFARGTQFDLKVKGGSPITENYSVLAPEVLLDHKGQARGQRNTKFIETLLNADRVIIAGQAASHCVKSSIDDLLKEIAAKDTSLAKKVYVLGDCMSAVTVPDGKGGFFADFTPQSDEALKRFADAGMHVVRSTDPIDTWVDF